MAPAPPLGGGLGAARRGAAFARAPAGRQARRGAGRAGAQAGGVPGAGEGGGYEEMVDWAPGLVNRVQLIGRAGSDAEMRVLPSGVCVAKLNIAVKRPRAPDGSELPPDWFELEAWEDLANALCARVSKGTEVSVQGVLRIDKWEDANTGLPRSKPKVRLTSFQLVRPYPGSGGGGGGGMEPAAPPVANARLTFKTPGEKYEHLLNNFDDYWDNRLTKRNPRAPDFKHKATGTGIWIDSAPAAVLERLEDVTVARGGDARPTMRMAPGAGAAVGAYAAGAAFAGGDAFVPDEHDDGFGLPPGDDVYDADADLDVPF